MTGKMGIGDLLDQTEIWQYRDSTAGELVTIKVTDMELSHILNLRRWLAGNARRLHSSEVLALYSMLATVNGEQASYDLECSVASAEDENPIEWLRDKPLYRALGQEIARRQGATADPGLRRHLTKAERVQLRHDLREIDDVICGVVRALDPATGMSHMTVAQHNAQIDSLIAKLKGLRRS